MMRPEALLAVLDRLMTATDPVSAHAEAVNLLEPLGATQLNYVQIVRGSDVATSGQISVLTNLPADWQRSYETEGMAAFDYTTRKAMTEDRFGPVLMGPHICDRFPDMTAAELALVQDWPNVTGTTGAITSRLADPVLGRMTGAFVGFTVSPKDLQPIIDENGHVLVLITVALNERILMLQSAAEMDETADGRPLGLQIRKAKAAPYTGNCLRDREREVLQGIIRGDGFARIADRLRLSEATVAAHLHNARRRLGVRTNEQGAIKAILSGALQP